MRMRSGELALHFAIRASTSRNCDTEAEAAFRPDQTKPVRVESRKGAQRLGLGRRQTADERGERREERRDAKSNHDTYVMRWQCIMGMSQLQHRSS